MLERLPRDVLVDRDGTIACPWCGGDMSEATLTLEALLDVHSHARGLRWADREADGTAGVHALATTCANCGKPSIAAFPVLHGEPALRLMAVRTAADVAWLSRPRVEAASAENSSPGGKT